MIGPQRSMPQTSLSVPRLQPPRRPARLVLDWLGRWLRRGDRSAVAVEMGIVAIPFFMMFLGTMEMSYDLYVQAALNNAVEVAARGVQVGNGQDAKGEKGNAFVAASVCPNLGGLLDCDLLVAGTVDITTSGMGPDYFSYLSQQPDPFTEADATNGTNTCSGVGGHLIMLRAWYNGPTFVGLLIPSFTSIYNGAAVHITVAQAGFVNEWFSGGQNC